MAKLTTADIKKMIPTWLNTEELKTDLREQYICDTDGRPEIDCLASELGLLPGLPADAVRDHIWSQWIDGNSWSRHEKRRLGEGWNDWFLKSEDPKAFEFAEDFCGGSDKKLIAEYAKDPARFQKCWHRCFCPKNDPLRDNFRLEVVSTPEDDKIVGWTIVVD